MKRKKGYAGKKKMEIREGKERKDISDLVMRYTKPVRDAINEEGKGKSAPLGADREVHRRDKDGTGMGCDGGWP